MDTLGCLARVLAIWQKKRIYLLLWRLQGTVEAQHAHDTMRCSSSSSNVLLNMMADCHLVPLKVVAKRAFHIGSGKPACAGTRDMLVLILSFARAIGKESTQVSRRWTLRKFILVKPDIPLHSDNPAWGLLWAFSTYFDWCTAARRRGA